MNVSIVRTKVMFSYSSQKLRNSIKLMSFHGILINQWLLMQFRRAYISSINGLIFPRLEKKRKLFNFSDTHMHILLYVLWLLWLQETKMTRFFYRQHLYTILVFSTHKWRWTETGCVCPQKSTRNWVDGF